MVGRMLSHYKVLGEISRGGMGIVYRALDVKLNREVALKVLPPELVADPERKRRFIQEAQAAAALEHPHIAVVYEIDEAEGETFVAMELLRGQKLRDVLQQERLPVGRSIELAMEVGEGLARAHDKGIVHRDVKPANVMVTEDGHGKIIDFGLAKLIEPLEGGRSEVETAARGETESGKVMGTLSYMSPEQVRAGKVDHRSDIFSFGVVLHEMLSGEPPFQRPSGIETLNAILKEPAPTLPIRGREISGQVRSELERVVEKCLAKDPGERYQTIKDAVVDLRSARRRLESELVRPTVRKRRVVYIAAAVGIIALVMAGLTAGRLWERLFGRAVPARIESLAVLPLRNLSGDPEQEYFAEGMTEELIADLAKLSAFRVISRTSVMRYKDGTKPLREIARELDVDAVVEGSVLRAGNRVRITAQLIEAASDRHLWAESYERELQDVLALQSEVARAIAQELRLKLTPQQEARLGRPAP